MSDELKQIGPRLRAIRNSRGWTLDEVALRAGMSASTLSRLESGKRQASLELLLPLTKQLGIRLDDLVQQETVDPRVNRPSFRRNGHIFVPLTPENAPIHTYKITYLPTEAAPSLRVHDGYEWLYVLTGKLRLVLGDRDVILGRGEAAEFDTRTPHSLSAYGVKPAQIISILNDTGARIHTDIELTAFLGDDEDVPR